MEGISTDSLVCRHIAGVLRQERFVLIDVGCSGGIHPGWRNFGERLSATGFDPNIKEIQRLVDIESQPSVQYVAAFVGLPPDHPIAKRRLGKPHVHRSPWRRCAASWTREAQLLRSGIRPELRTYNLSKRAEFTNPDNNNYLPGWVAAHGVEDVDFLKIDVDGADFDILRSASDILFKDTTLGVGIEVNFIGSEDGDDHTFHNTDRFLRSLGFDLFGLTVRKYSSSVLPGRYLLEIPAQSEIGRPLQGDALYIKDVSSPEMRGVAEAITDEKLIKLIGLFSLFGLIDQAAEVIVRFRERLTPLLDPDHVLDMLAEEIQQNRSRKLSYAEYLAAFERNDCYFYNAQSYTADGLQREELESAVRGLESEIRGGKARLAALESELDSMRRSRSWRLTAPLRWLR